LQKIM